jgi:hypothetical protein
MFQRIVYSFLLILLLAGCGQGRAPRPLPPAPAPVATSIIPALVQQAAFPRYWGAGQLVSSQELADMDMQLLGIERENAEELLIHLGLYNNSTQEISFDAQGLFQQAFLSSQSDHESATQISPQGIELKQGNVEVLIPRTALLVDLTIPVPRGERFNLQVPSFPSLEIDVSAPSLPQRTTLKPLAEGVWQAGHSVVGNVALSNVGLQLIEVRVDEQEVVIRLGITNLHQVLIVGAQPLNSSAAYLIDGQGIAYQPTKIEGTLASPLFPPKKWFPGERYEGTFYFPRPATGALRFELPTFPPLLLMPGEPALVSFASDDDYPPTDGTAITVPNPLPLSNLALAQPLNYEPLTTFPNQAGQALTERNKESFLQLFTDEARLQMEAWWLGAERLILVEPNFELRDTGVLRGTHVVDAKYFFFYRLGGDSPENEFMLPVTLDFLHKDGRWHISRWQSNRPIWAQIWEQSSSANFLVLAAPSLAEEIPLLSAEAEVALLDMAARLQTIQPRDHYLMMMTATQEGFEQLTGHNHTTQGLASHQNLISQEGIETNSLSFILNGATLASLPQQVRRTTMAHELVHLLLAPVTRPYTPPWVGEGCATYFSEGIPWYALRAWILEGGLESPILEILTIKDNFSEWSIPQGIPVQYAYSAALTGYLVERFGQPAFLTFYQDFANPTYDERYRNALQSKNSKAALQELRLTITNELVQQHFGLSLPQLEVDFEPWLLRKAAEES